MDLKNKTKQTTQKNIADIIKDHSTGSIVIGRPKGSSDTATRELCDSIEEATKEAVCELKELKSKSRSHKKRLKKGSLKEIISAAKQKFHVPEDIIISTDVVRQRLKRGRNNGHAGHKSPMEDIEPYLVELIKKLADMRTPITTSQGLQLANLLIEGKLV
jgi:hypothetical protein